MNEDRQSQRYRHSRTRLCFGETGRWDDFCHARLLDITDDGNGGLAAYFAPY